MVKKKQWEPGYMVICELCDAFTKPWSGKTEEEAIANWNTRKKPYESRKKLPCPKCGTPRPQTWFTGGMWEEEKVWIKCRKCGYEVYDKSEIQAIREWNAEKREG